ncbi:hypothetical protein Tco_0667565, partial [Tanacetum coccineum]
GEDALGVAVEFEEIEENDDESDLDFLQEDDEEEEDGNNGGKISQAYDQKIDPQQSQKLAEE